MSRVSTASTEPNEPLLLLSLPAEILCYIFEKVNHKDWLSCTLTCEKFFSYSQVIFVTKLLTKMLSSEWIGKTQWCVVAAPNCNIYLLGEVSEEFLYEATVIYDSMEIEQCPILFLRKMERFASIDLFYCSQSTNSVRLLEIR
jgi:hypothetical protein